MLWLAFLPLLVAYAGATSPAFNPDPDSVRPELLPDLTGQWSAIDGKLFTMRLHQPYNAIASPPHSRYQKCDVEGCATCHLRPDYDYETRARTRVRVVCNGVTEGELHPSGCRVDLPRDEPRWEKVQDLPKGNSSGIHTVHMIYMNHYDVGYTGFVNDVDNTYMHQYFQLAAKTAQTMRANGTDRFIYTSHAWLIERYLDYCPCLESAESCAAQTLNNNQSKPLTCPTPAEIAAFKAAVDRRDIVWHAGPFNWQPENMAPALFDAGFDHVRRLDERFYHGTKNSSVMSVRDVIYVTRSVLPYLAKRGITGLTIGSNGADFPPQESTPTLEPTQSTPHIEKPHNPL